MGTTTAYRYATEAVELLAIVMYLKASPDEFERVEGFSRDVRGIGHHGTGDLEVRLRPGRTWSGPAT